MLRLNLLSAMQVQDGAERIHGLSDSLNAAHAARQRAEELTAASSKRSEELEEHIQVHTWFACRSSVYTHQAHDYQAVCR